MSKMIKAALAVAALSSAGLVHAGTKTAPLSVTVNVTAGCSLSATALNFAFTPGGGNVNGTSTVQVACSPGTNPTTIAFDNGANYTSPWRQAANGAARVQYNLYTDATFATILGGANTVAVPAGATFAAPKTVTINAQVPDNAANGSVAAGAYTDTVTATLNF